MADIDLMTNAALAKELERRAAKKTAAVNQIFEFAAHGFEKFNDIVQRLGDNHKLVIAWRSAEVAMNNAQLTARMRVGAGQPGYMLAILLRASPRWKPKRVA